MAFYPALKTKIGSVSTNVYINVEANVWNPKELGKIEEHLAAIQSKYPKELKIGQHHVVILWEIEGKKMTDVWVFGEKESESAGAGVWVYTFEELERYESANVTAADGLVVLGEEAKELTSASDR